jgi:hypothetical protein
MKITFREPCHGFPELVNEPWHGYRLSNDLCFHLHFPFITRIALHNNLLPGNRATVCLSARAKRGTVYTDLIL